FPAHRRRALRRRGPGRGPPGSTAWAGSHRGRGQRRQRRHQPAPPCGRRRYGRRLERKRMTGLYQAWGPDVLGSSIDELDTPALLIDRERLDANLEEMARFARRHGVVLRPHVKTHKSPDIARLQVESGAAGVTVAKLGEAEVMAAAGLTDIFIAFPIVGAPKVRRLLALTERARVSSIVDDLGAARVLSDAFEAAGRRFPVRIKIDVG